MEFHKYQTLFEMSKGVTGLKIDDYYKQFINYMYDRRDGHQINTAQVEWAWFKERKPYYHVWPGIISCLLKVDLEKVMTTSLVLPHEVSTLAILFPKGYEVDGIKSILVNEMLIPPIKGFNSLEDCQNYVRKNKEKCELGFLAQLQSKDVLTQLRIRIRDGVSIQQMIRDELEEHKAIIKLITTLFLLENDPDIINPDVISDDRLKWTSGDEELKARLEDKAKRRGKIGWDIGRNMEVNPHYRNSHFAIRWTNKGRTTPKLVKVKGCVVHREKIEKIPTGYDVRS